MIKPLSYKIHINEAPMVVQMGIGIHGDKKTERWLLPDIWSLHLYQYRARLVIDSYEVELEPGMAVMVPAGLPMTYHFEGPGSRHHYALFKLKTSEDSQNIQLVKAPNALTGHWKVNFKNAAEIFWEDSFEATLGLWLCLKQWILKASVVPLSTTNPLILEAQAYMSRNLRQTLQISKIARDLGVSHNLLLLRFRESLGCSPLSWLRHERMKRAQRLLKETNLPIKLVAAESGYLDLQQFNKSIRSFFGKSPRALKKELMN